jgi:uncharacterized membrane protein (UPF0127 family)
VNFKVLRWAVIALLAVGAVTFLVKGANGPADPTLAPATGQASVNRTPFGDFGEIAFRIEGGTGADVAARAAAVRCALLADTQARQELGLMNRTDLGGYDGMIFKFSADTNVAFYMKDTPLPLSIAFFDGSGQYVSGTDMPPCIHQATCPTFSAARPYRYAIEVPQGAMPRLGIGAGTRLVTAGACP